MSGLFSGRASLVLATILLAPPLSASEEAWRGHGRRMSGTLSLDDGRLRFTTAEGEAVPIRDVARVRFADAVPPPFRIGDGRRVHLRGGQKIAGQILALDEDKLTLRTAWAAKVELPRAAVAFIDPLPGWRTVAADDFSNGLKDFTTRGEPERTEAERGPPSLVLRADGQELNYVPAKVLIAGRVGVNFQEQGRPSGARWTCELRFQDGERSRRVVVAVAGAGDHYAVDAAGHKGTSRDVARTPGWHRLVVRFGPRALRITCDEDVLWYDLDQGTSGRLKQVTIRCQRTPEDGGMRGAVAWTEFCLERAVPEHAKPPTDPEQDEARLADDDQLFGRILGADRRVLRIEGRFGKRSLPWTELAGCSFRRPAAPAKSNGAADVRVLLRSGLDSEADILDGIVTALDERWLTLRHALLGDVRLERSRLRELRPLSAVSK